MAEMLGGGFPSQINGTTFDNFRKELESIAQILQDRWVDMLPTFCDSISHAATVIGGLLDNRSNTHEAANSEQPLNEAYLADEINQIQWYLYVYNQCTFTEIYRHLKWYYMRLGSLTHSVTKRTVRQTLTEMISRNLLQTSRSLFKTYFSLTDASLNELKKFGHKS